VSPKRRDRVAPPPAPGEWEIRFYTNDAAKGWGALCQQAATNTAKAWHLIREDPRPPVDDRHFPLRGALATRLIDGVSCDHWELEVTGGGRIFYAIDDSRHTVWITVAGTGHPKVTD
jgi:hypothetical protein